MSNSGEFFLKYHILGDQVISIRADRFCDVDDELYEDYGDSNDDIYLLYHGFVPESNSFRCIDLRTPRFADLKKEVKELLQVMAVDMTTASHSSCVTSNGWLGDRQLVIYSSMSMNDTERINCRQVVHENKGKWNAIFEACGYSTVIQEIKAYLQSNEAPLSELTTRTLQIIRKYLSVAPSFTFYGSIDEDEEEIRKTDRPLPIQYRLNFKRLWLEICDLYQAKCPLRSFNSRKYYTFEDDSNVPLKKKLKLFNQWFQKHAPSVQMVEAVADATYRISVRATQDIHTGEAYLGVPTKLIIDKDKAEDDPEMGGFLTVLKKMRGPPDNFHKLLMYLMYQRFILGPNSKYWPYLRLLPSPERLDVPGMWPVETIESRIYPSAMMKPLIKENKDTLRTFSSIVNITEVLLFFPPEVFTFENYNWAKMIINSRSIWWDGERHLVPMLDFINHAEGPDPKKVHSTRLDNSKKFAVTNACMVSFSSHDVYLITFYYLAWAFAKGEPVFENYGQPNHVYYTYHGFVMKRNYHGTSSKLQLLNSKTFCRLRRF